MEGGPSILIVDDEAAVTMALEGFFRNKGYHVLRAFYGDQAVEKIEQDKPALVILDLQMPGVDGISVLRKIRADFPQIKTLVMTGYAPQYQKELEELKPEMVKIKPVSLDDLTREVEILLGKPSTAVARPQPEAPGSPLRILFVEGSREIFQRYLEPHFETPGSKVPCETAVAIGPEEAFQLLSEFKPHLVLLDGTRMPIGVDAGKLAADLQRTAHAPREVIFYTFRVPTQQGQAASLTEIEKLVDTVRQVAKRHRLLPASSGG